MKILNTLIFNPSYEKRIIIKLSLLSIIIMKILNTLIFNPSYEKIIIIKSIIKKDEKLYTKIISPISDILGLKHIILKQCI
jgi:hypothetical protein